ncbi:MAG: polysaccharide biosynthesis/export family protein [Muribaculaceae bacterium]|nr:polysaccharide biosynthesis/export family protein [Muribaculaceae bacterium]MDE6631610.1 polysaccharide biosynthesis/export family protein [Muribaculaceae bacterium]
MTNKSIFKCTLLVLVLSVLASSCTTPKNITYFQGSENADVFEIALAENNVIRVEPFDKLSIMVSCKDAKLAQMFNLHVFTNSTSQRTGYNGTENFLDYNVGYSDGINGFTVSADGTIDYPILGKIKIEGMTRSEVAAFIKGEIMGRGLIKDPVVTVEFLNVGISVLGEVISPGRYDLNVDVLSIVEALSLAGDLTIQGNRQNIKVLRKEGDKIKTYVVDITDTKNLVNSPAYYLKQGDIVYVEPNNIRKRQTTNNGNSVLNVSFWVSVASLLTSAAILFKR